MKMKPGVRVGAPAVAFALLLTAIPAAASTAPPMHDLVFLFPVTFEVTESAGTGGFSIQRTGHGAQNGTVDYATSDGSAVSGSDYTSKSGTVSLGFPDDATEVQVPVINDSTEEAPETVNVTLSNPAGAPDMIVRFPVTGTMTIIDDDGPARISFGNATYSDFENRSGLAVSIIRSGDASGTATVSYSTSDGGAVAGDDYEGIAGTTVEFAPGERVKRETISFINDSVGEDPEDLTVSLSDPVGAAIADPSATTVEILDDDSGSSDTTPPVTSFHRPRNGKTYKRSSPYAKELHVSPGDEGSGLDTVQLALQKKRRDGTCAWYRGTRFRSGKCSVKKWVDLKRRLFIIYRLKNRLKPTTKKTGLKKYIAFSRATDKAGNTESVFEAGRNKVTYKIAP
jgi:hypothetical protein